MTDAPQPVAGSLSAKIIRACPKHDECPLECVERKVIELGEVAKFETHDNPHSISILERIKEKLS